MRKYLFLIGIGICFIGCIFLLTAGGGGSSGSGGSGKNSPSTGSSSSKTAEFLFGDYPYLCAGGTINPIDAIRLNPNTRQFSLRVEGVNAAVGFRKAYNKQHIIYEQMGNGACFKKVSIPYTGYHFNLISDYYQAYPCNTPYGQATQVHWWTNTVFVYSGNLCLCINPCFSTHINVDDYRGIVYKI